MKRFATVLTLVCLWLLPTSAAKAHPHTWIDVDVRVVFDAEGRVTGLRQMWLFDAYYSMFVVEGAPKSADGTVEQAALDALLAQNLKGLSEANYFTYIYSGEAVLGTGMARDGASRMVEDRLEMTFFVPLDEPVEATDLALRYKIYDPSYYVEMLHLNGAESVELVSAPGNCRLTLQKPEPSESDFMYAASLSQTETGYDGLGQLFAETVSVTCG